MPIIVYSLPHHHHHHQYLTLQHSVYLCLWRVCVVLGGSRRHYSTYDSTYFPALISGLLFAVYCGVFWCFPRGKNSLLLVSRYIDSVTMVLGQCQGPVRVPRVDLNRLRFGVMTNGPHLQWPQNRLCQAVMLAPMVVVTLSQKRLRLALWHCVIFGLIRAVLSRFALFEHASCQIMLIRQHRKTLCQTVYTNR